MTLDFINVGYGDAILIRSGSFTMLVDCGATIFQTESSGGNVYRYRRGFPPEPDAC